jgi:hypothetical protein
MQGFDPEKQTEHKQAKEIELRRQQRHDQTSQRRNIPSMDRDWIKVGEIYKPVYTLEDLSELMQAACSADDSKLLYAAQGFRKLLSNAVNTPIQQVIDLGVVPLFLEWTQRFEFSQLQYEACWILTNISAGNSLQTQTIIEKGAVPILLQLLSSSNATVREQAVWTLGNIAGDSSTCRDIILQYNGLALLAQVGEATDRPSLERNVYWSISNLCRGKPPPKFELIRGAILILAKCIKNQTAPELLADCLYSLAAVSEGNDEKVQAVIDSGILPWVIQMLSHHINSVAHAALKTIGNVAQGSEHQTQLIIELGVLTSIYQLLGSSKRNVVKEAVWTCSNMSAGSKEQLDALFAAGIFPRIVNILMNYDVEVKKEAAWAICNAVAASTPEQVAALVQANAIEALCGLMKMHSTSHQVTGDILLILMQGLNFFLKCGQQHFCEGGVNPFVVIVEESGGLKVLEDLQSHPNPSVYQKALGLLENYFDLEEDESDSLLKAIKECSQFNF